jgi:hypothetical protein
MVEKNMDHSYDEIEQCKNKRYSCESTKYYQKDRDSTKIGGTNTKIDRPF